MYGITILDIAIAVLFLYFILNGFSKGFIKQTSTIIGIIIALMIAINYYQGFQVYIEPYLEVSPGMLQFISFGILFILVNVFIHLLGMILKKILDLLFLEPLDHITGAALGLVKGVIFTYLLVLLLDQIPYTSIKNMVNSSFLATSLLNITPLIQQNLQEIFRP